MATVYIQKYTGQTKTTYSVKYKDPYTGRLKYFKSYRTKRDAQMATHELRAMIDSGNLVDIRKKVKKVPMLGFREVVEKLKEDWEEKRLREELAASTFDGYLLYADLLVRRYGDRLIREFTRKDVVGLQTHLKTKNSAITANRTLFVLKQIFKKALFLGAIFEDPSEDVKYLSEKKHERNKFILPDQIEELVTASRKTKGMYYMPALIYLGAEHGASRQEAISLTWDDVIFDFEEAGLIRFFRTKNGKERTDLLMPRTREALLELKRQLAIRRHRRKMRVKENRFVFCHLDGSPLLRFDNSWRKACKLAGLKNFHFHDLRHTFCSNLLISGATLKDVKEMIGHNDIAMTDRYSHLTMIHKRVRQMELAKHYAGEKKGAG